MGAGTCPLPVAPEQAELLAAPIALRTDVGAWGGKRGLFEELGRLCVGGCSCSAAFHLSPLPEEAGEEKGSAHGTTWFFAEDTVAHLLFVSPSPSPQLPAVGAQPGQPLALGSAV